MRKNLRREIYRIMNLNANDTPQFLVGKEIIKTINRGERLNSSKIANATFTSKPTVTRFAQQFGFNGFKEFNEEITKQEGLYYSNINLKSFEESYQNFDKHFLKLIDDISKQKDTIFQITNLILQKKEVYIVCTPETLGLGTEFADRLRFLGIKAHQASNYDKQIFLLSDIKEDDFVIFLVSGYTHDSEVRMYNDIKDSTITSLICTNSKKEYFSNPDYLIDIDPGINPLRVSLKPNGFRHILDQIVSLITFHDAEFMNRIVNPKFKY